MNICTFCKINFVYLTQEAICFSTSTTTQMEWWLFSIYWWWETGKFGCRYRNSGNLPFSFICLTSILAFLIMHKNSKAKFMIALSFPSILWSLSDVVRIATNLQFAFQSYMDLTGTWWTCIYFISFYVISVLWLLNLVSCIYFLWT